MTDHLIKSAFLFIYFGLVALAVVCVYEQMVSRLPIVDGVPATMVKR